MSEGTRREELISILRAYQELCNRFDMKAAMEYCTDDCTIAINGTVSSGYDEVFRIHEGDRGCRMLVDFTDFEVDGDTVSCFFHAESEIDRALGLGSMARWNRITFKDNKIHYWDIDNPPETEIARRNPVIKPFLDWAAANHPELLGRMRSTYNYESAAAEVVLADLWRQQFACQA